MLLNKLRIAHEHFIDFEKFKVAEPFYKRLNLVGYVGRLVEGKGILELLIAFNWLHNLGKDVNLLIIGGGLAGKAVQAYIEEAGMEVEMAGWVPHDRLPEYYNRMKLLVLPSYTEALPNVMLEAMACGTPVLVTPVGAIPDYIRDEVTGFILDDNDPATIFGKILAALRNPRLGLIADEGRKLVEKEFAFESAVEGYRRALLN